MCRSSFTGDKCETKLQKPCADSNCLNNGKCFLENGKPVCVCPKGWTGLKGEIIVKGSDICDYFCKNGGSCLYEGGRNPPVCRFVVLNHIPFNSFKPT